MSIAKATFTRRKENMMQNLGNRRSVQKCAQNAGSNVLKARINKMTPLAS